MKQIKTTIYERMLVLQDQALLLGKVATKKEWCTTIGVQPPNMNQLKLGKQTFTHEQIRAAVNLVEASYDFVYGRINTIKHPK